MIRLHVRNPLTAGAGLALEPDQARYLTSVMRRGVGDEVLVFNGADGEWRARLAEAGKRGALLALVEQVRPQAVGPDLDLVIALVKRTRLETIVEKAAELGARRVRLVITERTNADHTRIERLQAIATEAAEQTGRLDVPEIVAPLKLEKMLSTWNDRRLLFCDEAGDAPPVLDALPLTARGRGPEPWAILIGPEGGFSPAERDRLRALPYATAASLGPRILRADTAAISALTLWQARLGDWA
ncbi:MAG: 16S rRNA (uracil(1498)-N(3))-methyltransferase [Caulobacteraceae bacterium]|nr:16S rRNA (uracil(1498)-N(3))-methyltransferase [Caulobacteraceae bacterium]